MSLVRISADGTPSRAIVCPWLIHLPTNTPSLRCSGPGWAGVSAVRSRPDATETTATFSLSDMIAVSFRWRCHARVVPAPRAAQAVKNAGGSGREELGERGRQQ